MIEKIDHVEVTTTSMEESIRFYTQNLGFRVKSRRKFDGSRGMTEIAYLSLGDSVLELLEFPDAKPILDEGPQVGPRMFALSVDDMDLEIERLEKLGVEICTPPRQLGESKRAEIKDNNGMKIELRQW